MVSIMVSLVIRDTINKFHLPIYGYRSKVTDWRSPSIRDVKAAWRSPCHSLFKTMAE